MFELKKMIVRLLPDEVKRKIKTYKRHLDFSRDYSSFDKMNDSSRFLLAKENNLPCLNDKTKHTNFDPHYVYHPAWASRVLAETKPTHHIDIGSVLSFSTILSGFIPTTFYDYRPANIKLRDFTNASADLLALSFETDSIESLSCMHVVEHIGLGRYGDPLDPEGDRKASRELQRVLAPKGNLLVVVPVGKPKLMFNAHRIYTYQMILDNFPELTLKEFSLIPDSATQVGIIENADPSIVATQNYGCGCFWFTK